MSDLFSLAGRTALVTGCRRGIGRAVTEAMAQAGADIIGVSRQLEVDSEVEQTVRRMQRRFTRHQLNLADTASIDRFIEAMDGVQIDILVNNAGIIRREAAEKHRDDYWNEVLTVNLTAPFRLTRGLAAGMLARGRGKIIFIASLLSFQGGIMVPGYAASKGGIAQLTKALANEWAGRGVNVNAIAPGYIATDNTAPLQNDARRNASILERIPAGRWGRPEDIGGAAVFLAGPASDYVHGTVLTVDGGWMAR